MISVDIAILGAGISGLVAAHVCKKAGLSTILIDKNPQIGGCIKSLTTETGFILEQGANTFALNDTLESLLKELELTDDIAFPSIPDFQQYIWDVTHNKPQPLPKGPFALLKSSLFTWKEKRQVVFGLFKKTNASHDTTIDELFSSLLGSGAVTKAIQPALRGIFGGISTNLIAAKTIPGITESLLSGDSLFEYMRKKKRRRKVFTLKNGNASLVHKLHNQIQKEILTGSVTRIQKNQDGFRVHLDTSEEISARRIIVATSGKSTAQLIADLSPELSHKLSQLSYSQIIAVHFSLNQPINSLKDGFGVLFPFATQSKIIGVLCNSSLFPHTAPHGKNLITVCLGGIGNEHLMTLSEQEIQEISRQELSKFFNVIEAEHLLTTYWPAAIPQFTKDTLTLEDEFKQVESQLPGIYFIGVDRGKIGVPDRVDYVTNRMAQILKV